MENIQLPNKFEVKKTGDNQADVIIEPCYPGYGSTLGNALRRVLLSSLPGVAVTAINIKGVDHEFSTIPGVKEDVVEIILNIKRLRFNLHGVDESKVTLKVKGEIVAKAKDIKATSEVDVISTDAEIATLTSKDAELEIEFILKKGRGYLPVESIEKKKFQLGTIAIDAIFTPIKMVNYKIESVRVGKMTNFDRLILSIITDGTITPDESVKMASEILVEHFKQIASPELASKKEKKTEDKEVLEGIDEEQLKDDTDDEVKPKKKRGRPKKV